MIIGKSRELLITRFNEIVEELINIENEIKTLPKGSVAKRNHDGKITYQLGERVGNTVKTTRIPDEDVKKIKEQVKRRQHLNKERILLNKELKGILKPLKISRYE